MTTNCSNLTIRFLKILTLVLLLTPLASSAQMLNVQLGPTFSDLVTRTRGQTVNFLNKNTTNASGFVGIEYRERKYWSISSNVGFFTTGGFGSFAITDNNGNYFGTHAASELFDFLSVNTLINLKYPLGKWTPFVSAGPQIDYLLSHDHAYPLFDYDLRYHKETYGLATALGVRYVFRNMLIGVRAEHPWNFNCLAYGGYQKFYTSTTIVALTFGYRIGSHTAANK